ncbi:unnamed protein product [Strongylus vulgaris]|uniref:F-box domain-containing protein n=1 Tax=Strongylus vulgaris TaxID=40348 RepID=A0A3P7JGU6_STRVU|nr:unnamed protein product [Strongylus vulgaris]
MTTYVGYAAQCSPAVRKQIIPLEIRLEIAERMIAYASLADVLRWRGVSRRFRAAAMRRLARYTTIHVRVYDGLSTLYEKASSIANIGDWHPAGCLLLSEMGPHELGIALDSRPKWKDVKILVALLNVFRENAIQIQMDSPIVELLVKEVRKK